jgi:hypothetical protein
VNNKGSFRIRAYIDCNGDNKYEDGIDLEPSMPLNLILADATVVTDNTAPNPAVLATTPFADGTVFIANGTFTPLNPVINMNLVCNVTGGGADGKLGLDKVFAGLINNLSLVNIQAVYKDSTVAPPRNHPVSNVYVTNPTAATGVFAGKKMFRPGDPAAIALAWPVLDSGRSPNGQGGDTSTMGGSALAKDNTPAFGQKWTITCVDAPGRPFPKNHPAVPAAILSSINYGQQFAANFCFWTNVTKNSGATGDPADRLYSVLRIVKWQVAGAWNVTYPPPPAPPPGPPPPGPPPAPPLAVLTATTAHTITIPTRTTIDMGRAQDNNVEVREPSGITTAVAFDGSV